MEITPKFECEINFQGPKNNILKLESDILKSIAIGNSCVNFEQTPNLIILLDDIGFDYIDYYENEKNRFWNMCNSRGIPIDTNDFLAVFKEDLKTNFNANFEDCRVVKSKTDIYNLLVTIVFKKIVDPRVLVLLTQIYGLCAYQYVWHERVRMIAQRGSYNTELPDFLYAVYTSQFNNNVFNFSTMYTNEKYEEGEEILNGHKCMYSVPLQNEETPPLILGMYYIEEDDDE